MSSFKRLKASGCRLDGLLLAPDGTPSFAATRWNGAWSEDQKNAALTALGRNPAALTAAQVEARVSAAIQAWLECAAQGFGYDNLAGAVSYASSSVDLWRRQGLAFAAWRDAVWQEAIARSAAVAAGTQAMPASDADAYVQSWLRALPQPSIPTS